MFTSAFRIGLVLLPMLALTACGGGDKSAVAPAPPVVVAPAPQENAFGANFGAAFRVPDTGAPVIPADGDIIPLSLTTEPVKIG